MARPSPSCAHDDDRLCLSPASPPCRSKAEKKESAGRHLSRHYPPCATPSSNSSLDHRRSGARIAENGFAASSGVSKSAKVVLVGSDDQVTPSALTLAYAEALRNRNVAVNVTIAPGLGHNILLEPIAMEHLKEIASTINTG